MVKQFIKIDHVEDGSDKVLSQYSESVQLMGMIDALNSEVNVIEDDIDDLKVMLPLDVAAGKSLDLWGEIVGVDRGGLLDVEYRGAIYVGIAKNNSEGTAPDIYAIWSLIINGKSDFKYIDNENASFSLWIQNLNEDIDYDLIYEATYAAKCSGVTFLPILVSFLNPIFAFYTDIATNTAGFGVLQNIGTSFYDDYVFPSFGSISETNRIYMTKVLSGVDTDYSIIFVLDTTEGPLFEADLITQMAIDGGLISFRDSNDVELQFISDGTASVTNQTIGDSYYVLLKIIDDDALVGELRWAGMRENIDKVFDEFQAYTESQETTWDALNPDGIIQGFTSNYETDVIDYYDSFVFPANYPGGGFTRVFSSNRFGFPSRYELLVVVALGDDTTAFLDQVNSEAVGFSIVDQAGVKWEYVGSMNITSSPLFDFPDDVATDVSFEITESDGTELGTIYKDGIPTTYDDFYSNFSTITKSSETTFNTNNPSGFGNTVTASTAIGGGYYSLLII